VSSLNGFLRCRLLLSIREIDETFKRCSLFPLITLHFVLVAKTHTKQHPFEQKEAEDKLNTPMNWNSKDENTKNRLWLERCSKDAKIAARHAARPASAAPASRNPETMGKNFIAQGVSQRAPRFLDRHQPLLMSMSRYIAEDNDSPLALQLRRYGRLRPSKLADNSLNFAPNRSYALAVSSDAKAMNARMLQAMTAEEADEPLSGGVKVGAARCKTYAPPPSVAASVTPPAAATTPPSGAGGLRPSTAAPAPAARGTPQQQPPALVAAAAVAAPPAPVVVEADVALRAAAAGMPPAPRPTRSTLMRPSSADYGWVPRSEQTGAKVWLDPRFHHSLVSTDVTKR
jgi:hypothetical protein